MADDLTRTTTPVDLATVTTPSTPAKEVPDVARRDLGAALLGLLGVSAGASLLLGCGDGETNPNEPLGAVTQKAVASVVAYVNTVLGVAPPGARTGDLATKTSATIGQSVVVAQGCLSVGDGGGGVFVWVTSGTDDGGTFIVPNGTGVGATGSGWKRIYDGPLSVKWFGTKGDGSQNDTTAVQNAISAATSAGGGVIVLPQGTYKCGNLQLNNAQRVTLAGRGGSSPGRGRSAGPPRMHLAFSCSAAATT